jgi:hypothetical protein
VKDFYGPVTELIGFACGTMTPVMLHASAFCKDVDKVILADPVPSYYSIVSDRFYDPHLVMTGVPGALEEYDLQDLEAVIPEGHCIKLPAESGKYSIDNLFKEGGFLK